MKRGNTALKRVVSVASVAAMAIAGAVLAAPAASAAVVDTLTAGSLVARTQPTADAHLLVAGTGALVADVTEYGAATGNKFSTATTGQVANLAVGSGLSASAIQVFVPSKNAPVAAAGAFNAGDSFTVTLPASTGVTFASSGSASIGKDLVTKASLDTAAGYSNTTKVLNTDPQATVGTSAVAGAVYTAALQSYTGGATAKLTDKNTITVTFNDTDPNKVAATQDGSGNGYLLTLSGVKLDVSADATAGAVNATVNSGAGSANNVATLGYVTPYALRIATDAGYAANAKNPIALPDVTVVETSNQAFTNQTFGFDITGTAAKATPSSKLDLGAGVGTAATETSLASVATITAANIDLRESFTATGLQVNDIAADSKVKVALTVASLPTSGVTNAFGKAANQQSLGVTVEIGSTTSESRLAGSSRYATAQKIAAQLVKEGEGTNVILANGTTLKNGADALSANFLAGAEGNAPILLTDSSDTLPSATVDALKYLFKDSAGTSSTVNLFIMGKTDSVSEKAAATAEQTIKDAVNAAVSKVNVVRVQGDNRYETSAAAATQANKDDSNAIQSYDLGSGSLKTAFVASGLVNADALAAGGFSAGAGIPVLLVDGDTVNAKVSDTVTALGIQQLVVLGGTDRVSDKAIDTLKANNGVKNVVRVAGSGSLGRYNTAALLNTFAYGTGAAQLNIGWNANTAVYLANAMSGAASGFADALTVGPLAGANKSVVLTTPKDTLPDLAKSFLTTNSSHLGSVTALGASDRIDASVITAAQLAIQ